MKKLIIAAVAALIAGIIVITRDDGRRRVRGPILLDEDEPVNDHGCAGHDDWR